MIVSAIFIGDPHFQVDNVPEVNIFIEKLLDVIELKKPTFVCILGDLLHTHERIHSVPMNKAVELIEKVKVLTDNLLVLVGNHDMYSNQEFLNTNHWMNGLKVSADNVCIVDHVVKKVFEGQKFIFCPYVYPGKFKAALDTIGEWSDAKCIMAHQEFFGCKMGAIESIDGDVWSEDLPPVISGHIHDNQRVGNVYYPGSAMQHSFGETGKNIISYVEFNHDNNIYSLEEIDLKLPRKKIVYVKASEAVSIEVPVMKEGDKVRMTVSGNQDDFKAFKKSNKYKKLVDSGVKVVFKPTKSDIVLTHTEHDVTDFHEILRGLVDKTGSEHVKSVYETIICGK